MKPFDITIIAVALSVSVLAFASDENPLASAGTALPSETVSIDSSDCPVVQDSKDIRLLLLYHNPGLAQTLPACPPPQEARPARATRTLLI